MPKLLMATTVPVTLSGFLLPFAAYFRARGWRVDAMANGVSGDADCVKAFDCVWDVPWSRNPLHPRNFLAAPKRVREIVVREGYDLVHVHTPVASFVARLALRSLRKTGKPRVIYTAHGFHFYEGGPIIKGTLYRKLEQMAGRWTDELVVINREDERAALRHGIVPRERLHYMPGIGVDTRFYSAAAIPAAEVARVRREMGLTANDRVLLVVAELIPRKRPFDALAAFALLGHANAHLAFAGPGPLLETLQREVGRLGIGKRVHVLGYRKDIHVLIQAATAMILCSAQEGLPRSVMESMCQAVPVIGTQIRGTTDLLTDGRGLLVPVGDVRRLADAMAWILDHPTEARALGERGRDAMAAYDISNIVRLHEDLYESILGKAPANVPTPAHWHGATSCPAPDGDFQGASS